MKALWFAAIAFILFALGGIYATLKPRSNIFKEAWSAYRGYQYLANLEEGHAVVERIDEGHGVTKYERSLAENGYTDFSINGVPQLMLIDMEGNEVYKWDLSTIIESDSLAAALLEGVKSVRRSYIYPNGDAVIMTQKLGVTPYGGDIFKVDKRGKVIWHYSDRPSHHDFDIGPDGKVYLITHEMTKRASHGRKKLSSDPIDYLEDSITILDDKGVEIKSFSITELLNGYKKPLIGNFDIKRLMEDKLELGNGEGHPFYDATHTNTVSYVTKEEAENFPGLKEGDLLVNLRELNIMIGVDSDREEIVWYSSGPWLYPHEPNLLTNGNILIFDNLGIKPYARVIEYDPRSKEIAWKFEGSEENPFSSETLGTVQPLKNGNVLIAESYGGRILEVDRRGEIVWEYKSPIRVVSKLNKGKDLTLLPFATRYLAEELPFLAEEGKALQSGEKAVDKK